MNGKKSIEKSFWNGGLDINEYFDFDEQFELCEKKINLQDAKTYMLETASKPLRRSESTEDFINWMNSNKNKNK